MRSLPCLGPHIQAVSRACSVLHIMYVHDCVHVCAMYVRFGGLRGRRFEARSYPDITHRTTLTRVHTLVGSQFSQL